MDIRRSDFTRGDGFSPNEQPDWLDARLTTENSKMDATANRLTMRCSELAPLSRWLLPAAAFPPPCSQRASSASR